MSIEKLSFERITKEQLPYTILLNSVIQNISNAEALAVYVFLYSLPPNWEINKQHLSKKFKLGTKKLRAIFSYLNRANLLEYHQPKDEATGKMLGTTIHLLSGENFDQSVCFKEEKTGEAKIAPAVKMAKSVDKSGGAIPDPAENRPCGDNPLQKKQDTKQTVLKNKQKSSLELESQKAKNEKRHEFAQSMDQMASEKRHIQQNEEFKRARMPQSIKTLLGLCRNETS